MPSDFRTTITINYTPTDALSGVCTLCTHDAHVQPLEVYQHKDIERIFVLFCSSCGGLFQVDLMEVEG